MQDQVLAEDSEAKNDDFARELTPKSIIRIIIIFRICFYFTRKPSVSGEKMGEQPTEGFDDVKRKRRDDESIPIENAPIIGDLVEPNPDSQEPVKKKKKEFLGKTNFVNDDEFEDILDSGWFYIDSSNNPQGPFSSKEMKQWYPILSRWS
jgi:hypothetical protein